QSISSTIACCTHRPGIESKPAVLPRGDGRVICGTRADAPSAGMARQTVFGGAACVRASLPESARGRRVDSVAGSRGIAAPPPAPPAGGIALRDEARQRDAVLLGVEAPIEEPEPLHAIRTEAPVVGAQLAPGGKRPLLAPEVEAERTRVALA